MVILLAVFGVLNVALVAVVVTQYLDIRAMVEARSEWWDAYASFLDENRRKHDVIVSQRDAHEELQRAFLTVVKTGRAA